MCNSADFPGHQKRWDMSLSLRHSVCAQSYTSRDSPVEAAKFLPHSNWIELVVWKQPKSHSPHSRWIENTWKLRQLEWEMEEAFKLYNPLHARILSPISLELPEFPSNFPLASAGPSRFTEILYIWMGVGESRRWVFIFIFFMLMQWRLISFSYTREKFKSDWSINCIQSLRQVPLCHRCHRIVA